VRGVAKGSGGPGGKSVAVGFSLLLVLFRKRRRAKNRSSQGGKGSEGIPRRSDSSSLNLRSPFDNLTLMDSTFTLEEVGLRDIPRVGETAAILGEFRKRNLPVPDAFVIPATSYSEYVNQPSVHSFLEAPNISGQEAFKAELSVMPLPVILERSLHDAYRQLSGPRDVFVSVWADGEESQIIGEEELSHAVKSIWVEHITRQVFGRGNPVRNPLPILVQQLEEYEVKGRLLTADPYTSHVGVAVVEVDYRDGSEKLFFDKSSGQLVKRLATSAVLAPIAIEAITPILSWVLRIESLLKRPQELRWGLHRGGISFTQVKPLSLWSRAPVATRVWSRVEEGDIIPPDSVGIVAAAQEHAVSLAREFPDKIVLLELSTIGEGELASFCRAKHIDKQRNLHLVLPPVRTVEALREAKRKVAGEGLPRGLSLKLYMQIVSPANVVLFNRFLEVGVDGAVLNVGELARGFLGAGELVECVESCDTVLWAIESVLKACREADIDFLCYSREADEEAVSGLLQKGVTQIVANASELPRLLQAISRVEKEVLSREGK